MADKVKTNVADLFKSLHLQQARVSSGCVDIEGSMEASVELIYNENFKSLELHLLKLEYNSAKPEADLEAYIKSAVEAHNDDADVKENEKISYLMRNVIFRGVNQFLKKTRVRAGVIYSQGIINAEQRFNEQGELYQVAITYKDNSVTTIRITKPLPN